MAAQLRIDNFAPANIKEKSYLETDAAVSATSVTLKSTQGFANNDYAVIGQLGIETAELRAVTVSGQTLSIAALTFSHQRFEDVTALKGNKIRVYRANNVDGSVPADGNFALLATTDIDPDQLTTDYEDPAGGSDYWYKFTYYNSTTATQTALSDSVAARGADFGHYVSVDDVREEAGFQNNTALSDSRVAEARRMGESEINASLSGNYTLPLSEPIPDIIVTIAKLMGAGYLLTQEYGIMSADTRAEGESKLKEGRDLLMKIKTHEIVLVNQQGAALVNSRSVAGWPDDSTEDAEPEDGGAARAFRMSDRF